MKYLFGFCLFAVVGIISCASPAEISSPISAKKENDKVLSTESLQIGDQNIISPQIAEKLAGFQPFKIPVRLKSSLETQNQSGDNRPYKLVKKAIKSSMVMKDVRGNLPLLYIFNYQDGGFLVLSADKRQLPILAYSEKNTFDTTRFDQTGASRWMEGMKEEIKAIRGNIIPERKGAKNEWARLEQIIVLPNSATTIQIEEPPQDCSGGTYFEKLPLTQTAWSQDCSTNGNLPPCSGAGASQCYRQFAGCGPVAIAQVMRYWGFPYVVNWAAMPNYPSPYTANSDLSNLISGIITAANSINLCPWGTATLESSISPAINNFGYTSSFTAYNYGATDAAIVSNLNNNRPVIMTGWANLGSAHIWDAMDTGNTPTPAMAIFLII